MKTKPFLLATAGSTIDGRVIDEKMLDEMAKGYDPKTYGARLNIEHIRGISGQAPFRAYGDVLELSIADVEVNFHGKSEKRKGLYGVFDVTDEAKELNAQGQKVYPSIEIEPNFGGKGSAYLMGVALTDSPASIATERLAFNRSLPGAITLTRDAEGQPAGPGKLEFADASDPGGESFLTKLGTMLDGFAAKFGAASEKDGAKPAAPQGAKPEGEDAGTVFDFSQMRPLFEQFGQTFETSIEGLRTGIREEIDQLSIKIKRVEDAAEAKPTGNHRSRPPADGGALDYSKVF
ncbi:GPO family capsid scaffolding protein [Pelagerythrobacter sp.]|uniref:GPO family capsid scaffolding protein n=1 Tax=Pelagerythrobacter sp. TaxID=2800702 RepID=UPI0035B349D0